MKKMIEFDANVLMGTNENWAVNAPNVVKEHIHYPNRTNNWCLEDQTTFEEELKATNPAYVAFTKFMKENGYAELADRELGTLCGYSCAL